MKSGTENKLKFKALKRRLGLPLWQVIGLLETLWRVTNDNAPAGDIGKLTNEEIAAAMEWAGEADELVCVLIEHRWLDEDSEFRLVVHDWSHHVSNFIKGNFVQHKKQFADQVAKERARESAKDVPRDIPPKLLRVHGGTSHLPTYLPSLPKEYKERLPPFFLNLSILQRAELPGMSGSNSSTPARKIMRAT